MLTLLAQSTTQPTFKVVMPFTVGQVLHTFFSVWGRILSALPWWVFVIVALLVIARLVFGPLGEEGKRQRRR